tara:strand:- start:1072 stop:1221 length:150 start_codon:yes stop_codon:yes gene_type:complete
MIATSGSINSFSTTSRLRSDASHGEESFEEFTARYVASIGLIWYPSELF